MSVFFQIKFHKNNFEHFNFEFFNLSCASFFIHILCKYLSMICCFKWFNTIWKGTKWFYSAIQQKNVTQSKAAQIETVQINNRDKTIIQLFCDELVKWKNARSWVIWFQFMVDCTRTCAPAHSYSSISSLSKAHTSFIW